MNRCVTTFLAILSFATVNNPLTFTTLNSTFCDLLVIDATVNNGASSYSIDVYDTETSDLLTNLSGDVNNGQIETSWDLTDGNGNLISSNAVTCVFTLSGAASPNVRGTAHPNTGGGSSSTVTKTYAKFFKNPLNDNFAVAWGFDNIPSPVGGIAGSYDQAINEAVVNLLTLFYDPFPDPDIMYWVRPVGGSGNVNNPGGDLSFNFTAGDPGSKQAFLSALNDSGNVFWSGHGSSTAIFPSPGLLGPKLKASEIGSALGNPTVILGSNYVYKPYKLVILLCCNGYSKSFADAFGIANYTNSRAIPGGSLEDGRSTDTVEIYTTLGKIPQAYVGWPCNEFGVSADPNSVTEEEIHLGNFFQAWQSGATITECMEQFGDAMAIDFPTAEGNGIPNDRKWELSGCADLTTQNRNP